MRSPKTHLAAGAAALAAGLAAAPTATAATPAARTKAAFTATSKALPAGSSKPRLAPRAFSAFKVDVAQLRSTLRAAPKLRGSGSSMTISLPTPEGRFARFAVRETAVMEPGLAAKHPEITTYAGRSLDVRGSEVHLELTPMGLTAAVRGGGSSYYVDPRFAGDARTHVVYEREALADPRPENEFVEKELGDEFHRKAATGAGARRAGGEAVTVKTYRLALVSDPSYAKNNGANGNTTAAKVVLMDRVNQLYEQDLAIHMVLIAGTDKLNLDTPELASGADGPCGADPCFPAADLTDCGGVLDRNTTVAGLLVGARTFDIGHIVLGLNGGGVAGLGVVGTDTKGRGCTGIPRPVGDYFAVDYVAHEMGHEFGGNHTFGGDQLNCSVGNRNTNTGVEPGSGTTVMAYAGICGQDNLQPHSDPYFSQRSIDEIQSQAATAEETYDDVQQTAFRKLDGADSYRLSYDGRETRPLTAASTATEIGAALKGILPAGGTATVEPDPNGDPTGVGLPTSDAVSPAGYTITFGGTLAKRLPALLVATGFTGDASGFVGEPVAGGSSTKGGARTVTANHAPTLAAPAEVTIPLRTPFSLTATGSDPDGDPGVTYLWEQNDTSPLADPFLGTGQGTLLVSNAKTAGPLFRVFGTAARYPEPNVYLSPSPGENAATTSPTRDLPDVGQVMADNTNALTGTCPTVKPSQYVPVEGTLVTQGDPVSDSVADCYSEYLPIEGYTGDGTGNMHFRVTARDGRPGMGGVSHADTTLRLAPGAGPFRITAPNKNAVVGVGSQLPVAWDVANTDAAPVSTAEVRILLSTDAGRTFGTVLAASTPNDGAETIALPAGLTTEQGRIRIEALGNVFYDASRGNLSIVDASQPPAVPATGATGTTGGGTPTGGGTTTTGSTTTSGGTTTPSTSTPGPAGPTGPQGPSATVKATPGVLRFFQANASRKIGLPVAKRRLLIAACGLPSCTVTATASLRLTSRRTGRTARTTLELPTLKLTDGGSGAFDLRLSAKQRAAIRRAKVARVVLTTVSAGVRRSFTYRLSVK